MLKRLLSSQGSFAFLPVAGAQLVRLQCIQDTYHFFYVTAYVQVVQGYPAYNTLRIYDESSTVSDLFVSFQDTQFFSQGFGSICQHREVQATKVFVVFSPGQVLKFAISRSTDQDSITVTEVLEVLVKFCNFGRAHKSEVLRPPKHYQPFAGAFDLLRRNIIEFFAFFDGNNCRFLEFRELRPYG